jgi:hypothetical protein
LGSSPFARHYSGSRGFFPFLGLLRCFSSPAWLLVPYVFRHGYARITTRGFPHSEIPGLTVDQHLTRAYRSHPRPSSPLGAKASTVCSYSLDQKEHHVMPLWSFQGAHELQRSQRPPGRRSFKTQQRDRAAIGSQPRKRLLTQKLTPVEVDIASRRVEYPDGKKRHQRVRRLPE